MSSSAIATTNGKAAVVAIPDDPIMHDEKLWQVVSSGDLKGLTPSQKAQYYLHRCKQEGLNPASQPFVYMIQQGKEILYGGKTAADQVRKRDGVTIVSVECNDTGDMIEYEVRVRDREGREDYEIGAIFVGTMKGQERANAKMKALSKAKRRATFSICGTGVMDESEIETIPGAVSIAPSVMHAEPETPTQAQEPSLPGSFRKARGILAPQDGEVHESPEARIRRMRDAAPHTPEVVNEDTGEIERTAEDLAAEIKFFRETLGWTVADLRKEAKERGIDLGKMRGLEDMSDVLRKYVDQSHGEPEQGTIIDVATRAVDGEAGRDKYTEG